MKSRHTQEWLRICTFLHNLLLQKGFLPHLHIFDNELPPSVLTTLQKDNDNMNIKLSPPHVHRSNKAEHAIQTFKAHFIAGLSSCHPQFPMSLWPHFLPQAQLTINLLRPSVRHPHLTSPHTNTSSVPSISTTLPFLLLVSKSSFATKNLPALHGHIVQPLAGI